MTIESMQGPLVVYGQIPQIPGGVSPDYNPDLGPGLVTYGGVMLLDPTLGFQPGGLTPPQGWLFDNTMVTLDQAPSVLSAVNIAAAQVPVAGTPLTLVSTTGGGVTVGVTITNRATNQPVTGLLALDGVATLVQFAQAGNPQASPPQIYDPTKALSRCVTVTSAGNDSAATFLVRGYDIYGNPMSQLLTGANIGVATTTKAFKYIASVTPAGTLSGSNVTVGTADVFGFPVYSPSWPYITIYWNNALITATTGYLAGVTTTATQTTGDVRGTYAVQSASDGTKRLIVYETVPLAQSSTAAGIVGVPQA